MAIAWIRGKRIEELPKLIQSVAFLYRNILWSFKRKKWKETDSEKDVRKKLSFGVEYVCGADVAGDVAEFGTMSGRTAAVIAEALSKFDIFKNGPKKLHLFDSFEGLPPAQSVVDRDSPHVKSGIWGVGTCKGISKERLGCVLKKFLPKNSTIIYNGWFKDTLPQIPKGTKFAMLHIDCDMYQSTIEVLDYLFQNLHIEDGTVIFLDDYNCNRASPNFGEQRAWSETVKKFLIIFTDCGEYGWSGRKFVIHHYRNVN